MKTEEQILEKIHRLQGYYQNYYYAKKPCPETLIGLIEGLKWVLE